MTPAILIKVTVALGFVLVLVLAVGWVMRRLGLHTRWQTGRSPDNRLSLVSSLMVDPRRRLVLIRRDDREHLLLLGQTQDVVIESFDATQSDAKP